MNRYGMGDGKPLKELTNEQKMEQTIKNSVVDMDLREYKRKNDILNIEHMFVQEVGLVDWNFSNRIYSEKFDEITLRNYLIDILQKEPEMISRYNKTDDTLYVGFYFKNPPGLVLHKRWDNELNVIPNFQTWIEDFQHNDELLKRDYIDLNTDDVGEIYEKRKMLYPEDGSIIDVKKYYIRDQLRSRVLVKKGNWCIGIKEPLKK